MKLGVCPYVLSHVRKHSLWKQALLWRCRVGMSVHFLLKQLQRVWARTRLYDKHYWEKWGIPGLKDLTIEETDPCRWTIIVKKKKKKCRGTLRRKWLSLDRGNRILILTLGPKLEGLSQAEDNRVCRQLWCLHWAGTYVGISRSSSDTCRTQSKSTEGGAHLISLNILKLHDTCICKAESLCCASEISNF